MPKGLANHSARGAPPGPIVLHDVLDFLRKRKLEEVHAEAASSIRRRCGDGARPLPSSTAPAIAPEQTAEFQWAMGLLTGLREREKRALERFVQKKAATAAAAALPSPSKPGYASGDEGGAAQETTDAELVLPSIAGGSWPADVTYSNDYLWDARVPAELAAKYQPASGVRRRPRAPCPRTYGAAITDAAHPAAGQFGLFAACALAHGAWVLDYVGAVSLGEHEDRTSDYVCDFGEQSELALDAAKVGNEARFVNDYRNTGRRANVEFRLRRDGRGELRQGVFVCAKEGVHPHEELLISYGKSFWRSRLSTSLEEFIVRRPGEAAPAGPLWPGT